MKSGMCKYNNFFTKPIILAFFIMVFYAPLSAQSLSPAYLDYIQRWHDLAVRHQQQYGIPASITLAQGLLESGAGLSRLATEGNNHFGIKCHKSWSGEGIYADDDMKNECFRKYPHPEDSFEDHARFLMQRRYKPLFALETTDYEAWAEGLKRCGYATDPAYPAKLVNIIEVYELFRFDSGQPIVAQRCDLAPDESLQHAIDPQIVEQFKIMHKIHEKWGLFYVVISKYDSYDAIAEEFGVKKKKLLDFNDVDRNDDIFPPGTPFYLQKKNEKMPSGAPKSHKVKKGESMRIIAQRYGIRLKDLLRANRLKKSDIIHPGDYIILP